MAKLTSRSSIVEGNVITHLNFKGPTKPTSPGDVLNTGGGGGTSDGMNTNDIHGRLSRIEGAFSTQQWAVGVISGAMLAALAIVIAITLSLRSDVSSLSDKVDALPGRIREEMRDLNVTLSQSITAARSADQPTIVVIPQASLDGQQTSPAIPTAGTPSE